MTTLCHSPRMKRSRARHVIRASATVVLLGLIALPVWAQGHRDGRPSRGDRLKAADINGDGQVTLEEFMASATNSARERFARMDRNGDGVLTPEDRPEGGRNPGQMRELRQQADTNQDGKVTYEELVAIDPNFSKERFDRMDHNGDGILSPEDRGNRGGQDRRARFERMFARADVDQNGSLTFEEIVSVRPEFPRERFDRMDRDGDGAITREEGPREGQGQGMHQMRELFGRADTNHDGVVSYEDIVAVAPNFPRERFDRMDRNGDGVMSAADRPKNRGGRSPE